MKQQTLKANNGGDGTVKVEVTSKGKIALDKRGFVTVSGHPMHVQCMNYEHIQKYYIIPEHMEP